jgi:hypothetical protein
MASPAMPDPVAWPREAAEVIALLASDLGYDALVPARELSASSGARTYLCRPSGQHGRANAMIVKVGPDDILASDVAGLKLATAYFRDASFALSSAKSAAGYTAIPLRLAGDDAVAFEDFYHATDSPDVVVAALDEIFVDTLRLTSLTPRPTAANVFSLYTIDDETKLARELRDAGDDLPGLVQWWDRARRVTADGSYSRLSHGDLHCRNILVGADPSRMYVIDFGQTDEHHALRDLAKLEREIHLTLLGASQASRWTSGSLGSRTPMINEGADPELVKASRAVAHLREIAKRHLPSDAPIDLEYGVALLAQFMFAAGNRRLPMATRRAALRAAKQIQADLVTAYPKLGFSDKEAAEIYRREVLWRFVYTFIRLDQQPGGCWSRTLHGWMSAIWAGDENEIYRDPQMRRRGGTDLTCYTMDVMVRLLRDHLEPRETAAVLIDNEVLSRAFNGLRAKIGFQGGSGTGIPGTAHADVKIRHTVMTVLATLRYRQGHDHAVGAIEVLRNCLRYLSDYLPYWSNDRAYLLGTVLCCVKLQELLDTDVVSHLDPAMVEGVRNALSTVIQEMLEAVEGQSTDVTYLPRPRVPESPRAPFFRPYCDFWRMERTGFLMYVSMAFGEDNKHLNESVRTTLGRRFVQCFDEVLADVEPWDAAAPERSLIRYHRGPNAPRDWGLSAELAALLTMPAVADLVAADDDAARKHLQEKLHALRQALLATFDGHQTKPQLFTFVQSAAILQSARAFPEILLTREDLAALDTSIDNLRNLHMTEWHLHQHVQQRVVAPSGSGGSVDVDGLRGLLVAKLEAGEYIEHDGIWDQVADLAGTIEPLDGVEPPVFAPADDDPAVNQLRAILTASTDGQRRVLEVTAEDGGSYREFLARWGHEVEELRLPDGSVTDRNNLQRAFRQAAPGSFDAVIAGGAMMRVPRHRTPEFYAAFHRVLRPGGHLLVSIRTKDHALIDTGGRFVQYYRDHMAVQAMLRDANFETQVIQSDRPKQRAASGQPYEWTHLFCRKPDPEV